MLSVPPKKWIARSDITGKTGEVLESHASQIAQKTTLTPLMAQLLALRNISPEDVETYLHGSLSHLPDPFLLKGMPEAIKRIQDEISAGRDILISADFDVDGISACSLLVDFFARIGVNAYKFIPNRKIDGYGLSRRALRRAAEIGIKLVISVDCGISAVEEAAYAKELGLDLIITDHHQPPKTLPEALAIINPHQDGCVFPFKDLCGAGVAFFLAVAVRKELREAGHFEQRPEPNLKHSLDLVGLATIADIVPLIGINRIMTKVGLELMDGNTRPGLVALRQAANVNRVCCGTVAFGLAPRINAAGRISEGRLAADMLLETDLPAALKIAEDLDKLNQQRQDIEKRTTEEAIARVEQGEHGRRTIVLAAEGWHPGVIGIVASRLVELYHRPTIIISLEDNKGKGSGRSIRGFHLFQNLGACHEHLLGFGGHECAAGLTISKDRIPAFADAFDRLAENLLTEEDMRPTAVFDAEIRLGEIGLSFVEQLRLMEPHGVGNPGPVFLARGVTVNHLRQVGTEGQHLSCMAEDGGCQIKCIGFSLGHLAESLAGQKIDMLFKPSINEWNGRVTVQAEVQDIRVQDH